MKAKTRERCSEALAVVCGLALIGFLLAAVTPPQVGAPSVAPIYVGSHGSMVALANMQHPPTNTGAQQSSRPKTGSSVTAASPQSVTPATANGSPRQSSATVSTAMPATSQKSGNVTPSANSVGTSPSSSTMTHVCGTPLSPLVETVVHVDKGLQSTIPLAKAVSATSGCTS